MGRTIDVEFFVDVSFEVKKLFLKGYVSLASA